MPLVQAPQPLGPFPTQNEGIFSFPFGLIFDKAIWDPTKLVIQLQADTFPSFGSPNLINVYSNGAGIVNYQQGPLGQSIDIQLPRRQMNTATTWYWQIRIVNYGYAGGYASNWVQGSPLVVQPDQSVAIANTLQSSIADKYAYSQAANSSNTYTLLAVLGRIFDQLLLETAYSQGDLILNQARDQGIQNNFAALVQLTQTATEPNASFRWKVYQLFKAFVNYPGVVSGILQVVEAFVGEPPLVLDATNTVGWILGINAIKAPGYVLPVPTIKLYSRLDKGFNWTLNVYNSWNLTYDQNVLENYVNLIKPAHTHAIFKFISAKHASIRLNTSADWNSGTLTNMTVNSAGGFTLAGGQTSGNGVFSFQLPWTPSSWDVLNLTQIVQSSNQTITYQIQSSATGSGYSAYETIANGATPSSTPLASYINLKVSMATTNASTQPILNSAELNLVHL